MVINKNQQNDNAVQNTVTSALATASKTPFWTAFKITLGIGLAQLSLFLLAIGGVVTLGVILYKVLS